MKTLFKFLNYLLTWKYRKYRNIPSRAGYLRYDIYSPKILLPIDFNTLPSNFYRIQTHVILRGGLTCPHCDTVGKYFALERNPNGITEITLYGHRFGKEVFFTKDHIIPLDKGGGNDQENFQLMCNCCNRKKSNSIPPQDICKFDDSNRIITLGDIFDKFFERINEQKSVKNSEMPGK